MILILNDFNFKKGQRSVGNIVVLCGTQSHRKRFLITHSSKSLYNRWTAHTGHMGIEFYWTI